MAEDMAAPNHFFEDAARVAGGAMGALAGVKREVESMVRQQFDRLLADMDLVTREEFDAVKEMAAKARTENEKLEARLAVLEAKQASSRQNSLVVQRTPRQRKSNNSSRNWTSRWACFRSFVSEWDLTAIAINSDRQRSPIGGNCK